jgi:hypothetical protein
MAALARNISELAQNISELARTISELAELTSSDRGCQDEEAEGEDQEQHDEVVPVIEQGEEAEHPHRLGGLVEDQGLDPPSETELEAVIAQRADNIPRTGRNAMPDDVQPHVAGTDPSKAQYVDLGIRFVIEALFERIGPWSAPGIGVLGVNPQGADQQQQVCVSALCPSPLRFQPFARFRLVRSRPGIHLSLPFDPSAFIPDITADVSIASRIKDFQAETPHVFVKEARSCRYLGVVETPRRGTHHDKID